MKTVFNDWIPFSGFKAINIFGILFVRNGKTMSDKDINHELIHTEQMKEMLYVFFYLWYFIEWFIRLFCKGNAYRNISFEKEAYGNDDNLDYLNEREPFAWMKFL